eukprot:1293091-Prymnesium_polylepis.1
MERGGGRDAGAETASAGGKKRRAEAGPVDVVAEAGTAEALETLRVENDRLRAAQIQDRSPDFVTIAGHGRMDMITELLKMGVDVNFRDTYGYDGYDALMNAALRGHADTMTL